MDIRGRGRPPVDEVARYRRLEVRVTDSEMDIVDELSFDLNMSRSDVTRYAIRQLYIERGGVIDEE